MSGSDEYGEVVCTIGVFDGMHAGHRFLLSAAQEEADLLGLPLLVVTFQSDPEELFKPAGQCLKLLSNAERLQRLADVEDAAAEGEVTGAAGAGTAPDGAPEGADRVSPDVTLRRQVLALPFTAELAATDPTDFLNQVLARHCTPASIHVGSNFRFGQAARGDVNLLRRWAATQNPPAQVHEHRLIDSNGLPVSASLIRSLLQDARLQEANQLLTRPHHLHGQIVRGRGFGKEIGFPTANISVLGGSMQPADGVYAGYFELSGEMHAAAISVGVPLTFEGLEASLEVYVLDYEANLYDREATIWFLEYLRPMIAFANTTELMEQISRDVTRTREIASHPIPSFWA